MLWKPKEVELKTLLGKGRDGSAFSPDLWKLEQYEWQLLFLTDVMRERHPLFDKYIKPFIHPDVPPCPAFTQEDYWSFWKRKLGKDSFGIPLVNQFKTKNMGKHNAVGRISGQLVAIRPYMFYDLDIHYDNRVRFNRMRTTVIVPYRKKNGDFVSDELTDNIRCWMYCGIPSYWMDQLDGGLLFEHVRTFDPVYDIYKWYPGRYLYWSMIEYEHVPSPETIIFEDDIKVHKQQTFTVRSVKDGN